jgi:hypothetical protein
MKKTVAIVHFNTPELTEAAILSVRKHGGTDYRIVVFDNSDKRPFPKIKGVEIIDNTKGQIINFDEELAKYQDRNKAIGEMNGYGSDKHMMSVQKLWELLPDGFVLMDSDVLIKENIDWIFWKGECCCGYVSNMTARSIPRLMPMLLWINVPICVAGGVRFFDPDRSWALHPGEDKRNFWDTGAAFYDDIRRLKPQCHGKSVSRERMLQAIEHFKSGSWKQTDVNKQKAWLEKHRDLWEPTPKMRGVKDVAICAIGRNENRYAVEWVEHYKKLGVKKIFVYDNWRTGDSEKLADVLQPFVNCKLVEVIDCHDRDNYQCKAYTDCYQKHGNEYAWIGFLDFDEFLRWDGKKKIANMFDGYDADCVLVNWRTMTDNGLVHYDPRPVTERFTKYMQPDKAVKFPFPENNHVKSFVRGGQYGVRFGSPHFPKTPMRCVNASGKFVKQGAFTDFDWSVMRIDHYWTKTAEEWRDVKLSREWPLGQNYNDTFMKQQVDFFFAVNKRTPEKEEIVCGKPQE